MGHGLGLWDERLSNPGWFVEGLDGFGRGVADGVGVEGQGVVDGAVGLLVGGLDGEGFVVLLVEFEVEGVLEVLR